MMDNVPMSAEGWLRKRQAEQRRSVERDEKSRIRTLLARTDRIGKNATRVAIALLDSGRSYEEIYESARRASPDVSDSVHRRNVMRGNQAFMEREDSPEVEEDWLRQARLAAEREWAAIHPQQKVDAAKFQNLKPSQIALGRMFASLARDAASTRPTYCGDHLDESLRQQGEAAAKWLRSLSRVFS